MKIKQFYDENNAAFTPVVHVNAVLDDQGVDLTTLLQNIIQRLTPVRMTQEEFDNLSTKDKDTIYFVLEES